MVYTVNVRFDWDSIKNDINKSKHGLSFEEAIEVFADPDAIEIYDEDHSEDEDRFKVIGMLQRRIVVISLIFTERDEVIRVISARKANTEEKEIYEQKR